MAKRKTKILTGKKSPQKQGHWTAPTSIVMDGMMSSWNNDFQFEELTNKWKAEERKRKIDAILRDSIKELEQENIDLKKEVENLKNKTNNNNE